jgi:cellulose synthase/poly-beta-1,6-N-acetylglucosamine synthase-like glycosyltransferase
MNLLTACLLLLPWMPVFLYGLLLWRGGRKRKAVSETADHPDGLSVILTCHNEEQHVVAKVHALLAQCRQLPLPRFELLVISDGSDDRTNDLLQQFGGQANVRLVLLAQRMGKPNALNVGVAAAQYPLLLLSDVRQELAPGVVARLCARMADPGLGAVSACLAHRGRRSPLRKVLNWLKALESRAGSTVGVYGPLYMLRRANYRPIPVGTVLDDLLISIRVLNQGMRVEVEPSAVMYDIALPGLYQKARMLRLASGLYQLAREHWQEMGRMRGRFVLFLFVQKYLKLLLPFIAVYEGAVFFLSGLPSIHIAWHLCWGLPLAAMLCVRELRLLLRFALHFVCNLHRLASLATVKWPKLPHDARSAEVLQRDGLPQALLAIDVGEHQVKAP